MYYFILALLLSYSTIAHASEQATASQDTVRRAYVWTDSLIAARGPFATMPPPEIALPDTIDGKLYWQGGVFVLPGTKVSVLNENGFLDVERKPGSVMHDYYEARWPVDMALDSLPLAIRQIRYHRKPFEYPKPWPEAVLLGGISERYEGIGMTIHAVPGLPPMFFEAIGLPREIYRSKGSWEMLRTTVWPLNISPENMPPELFSMTKFKGIRPQ